MRAPEGTQPPQGWRFPVSEAVMLTAPLKPLLIEQITRWRIANGQKIGTPEIEVDRFICTQFPANCHEDTKDRELPAHLENNRNFLDRVADWISPRFESQPQGGYPLEADSVAEARVSPCASCPRNRAARPDCPACASAFDEAFSKLRNLRPKPANCGAQYCSLYAFDCYSAACLPREIVEPDDELRVLSPPACWLHKKVDEPEGPTDSPPAP